MRIKNTLYELIVFLLISIWAYTLVSKTLDFETFKRQINGAYILSDGRGILPYLLQAIHAILILLLISKKWRRIGLITSLMVLIIYTAYLVYVLNFAPTIPCSCIAIVNWMNWNDQLYFNFIILAINIVGLIMFTLNRHPHSKYLQTTTN